MRHVEYGAKRMSKSLLAATALIAAVLFSSQAFASSQLWLGRNDGGWYDRTDSNWTLRSDGGWRYGLMGTPRPEAFEVAAHRVGAKPCLLVLSPKTRAGQAKIYRCR
jgi:hypothetical protein